MRFKRPQVRYADTPQPATPYQSAAQVWDERIGSARVQAKNWRFMAFGCLVLALLMAGGLVWRSAQSIVTPYVVEVDNTGQVRAVGEAAAPPPSTEQPAWAKRLHRRQQLTHADTTAAHTLRGGDGGSSSQGPSLRDSDS